MYRTSEPKIPAVHLAKDVLEDQFRKAAGVLLSHSGRAASISLVLLLAAALPAQAQKVFVDYDSTTPFSEYRTFQYRETKEDLRDFSRTSHQRVVEQLIGHAIEGGLEQVDSDPDIYLAYYTADRGTLRLAMKSLEYSYGDSFSPGAYWEGGVGTRTPDSFTFKQGTLVVDAWDAKERRLVWRGIATAAVSSDPDRNDKKIEKALNKIMKRWDEDRGGRARALRKLKAEQAQEEN